VVLALAGCTPTPEPVPEPTPTASETPTPTPTPTIDAADPANWIIGFSSLGPLRVGGTIAEALPALTAFAVTESNEACPWFGDVRSETYGYVGLLLGDDDVIDGMYVGRFAEVPPITPFKTAEGISGVYVSTEAELLAAYPDIEQVDGPYTGRTYYSIADGSGYFINFDVSEGVVAAIMTGTTQRFPKVFCD
jgi:hypothetical protein